MKCPYCGTQLPEDAKFCSVCGSSLTEPIYETSGADSYDYGNANESYSHAEYQDEYGLDDGQENASQPAYAPQPKNNRALLGIVIAMGVVIVVLLVVLLVLVFADKEPEPLDTGVPQVTDEAPLTESVQPGASTQTPVAPAPSASQSATAPAASVADSSATVGTMSPGSYRVNTQQDDLNIRSGAGTQHPVVGRVPKNTVVSVTAVNGDWAYITYGTVSGWVAAQYLVPAT